jgi:hypothetical protein
MSEKGEERPKWGAGSKKVSQQERPRAPQTGKKCHMSLKKGGSKRVMFQSQLPSTADWPLLS